MRTYEAAHGALIEISGVLRKAHRDVAEAHSKASSDESRALLLAHLERVQSLELEVLLELKESTRRFLPRIMRPEVNRE